MLRSDTGAKPALETPGPSNAVAAHLPEAPEGSRFGDYVLEKEIAHGGMGVVYRARQLSLGRMVAVKLLLLGRYSSAESVERFRREAQSAAALRHPHIVSIHEIGEHDGQQFFSMDYVDGQNLGELVRNGPFEARRAAEVVLDIAKAIHYAHEQGVLHRDLKPGNVLLDAFGQVRITDFGLAKKLDGSSDLTVTGQMVGTPNYLSPEQAVGKHSELGPPSDVYSIGALMYELLTGRPPFLAKTLPETLLRIRDTEPVSPRALNPALDRDVETICLKCLRKEPVRRYPTAQALAEDLDGWLHGRPIKARPVSSFERAWLWARRNPRQAWMAGFVFAALAGLMATLTLANIRIRAAQHQTQLKADESRQRLIRRYVAEGNRLMEQNRTITALPWLVEALELESGDLQREADERLRIAQAMIGAPRLLLNLSQGKSVTSVALSPDGSLLASGSEDGTVRISEVAAGGSGGASFHLLGEVTRLSFSPDGRQLVAVDMAGQARLWNAATRQQVKELLAPPGLGEKALAEEDWRLKPAASFSPDGKLLLLACRSRSAELRDAATGELQRRFSHPDIVYHAAFSPDGRYVVTASRDRSARVWDVASGEQAGPTLQHEGRVVWAQFNSDGSKLLTLRDHHFVQLWDWREGRRLAPEIPRRSVLSHASLSPDGTKVLTTARSGYGHVYDAASSRLLHQFIDHGGMVDAAFSPDGRHIATAAHDGNVWLRDSADEVVPPMVLPAGNQINEIAFSSDGRRLAIGTRGGHSRVWELSPPPVGVRRLPGNDVQWLGFDASGRRALLLSTGGENSLRIYELPNGKLVSTSLLPPKEVTRAWFSPDGKRVLALGDGRTAHVFEVESGRELLSLTQDDNLRDGLWSPDGKFILSAAGAGGVRAWDSVTGKVVLTFPCAKPATAIALSAAGDRLATGHSDNTVQIWEASAGRLLGPPIAVARAILELRFSPDGTRIAIASGARGVEGIVEIRDVASGQVTGRQLVHRDKVNSVEFSGDGRLVATTCEDLTARVWDALTGEPVTPWLAHDYEARYATFSPDGARLVTMERRGAVRLWSARTGEPLTLSLNYPRNTGDGWVAVSPDGQELLLSRGGDGAWLRDLRPETSSLAKLKLLAEVISCTQFNAASGLEPLDEAGLDRAWQQLSAMRAGF